MKNYTPFFLPILYAVLISALFIAAIPGVPSGFNYSNICLADTFLAGSVSGVWNASTGNFLIYDSIWVAAGNSLTINAGVQVKFAQNITGLTVFGTLIVNGEEGDSVYFTSSMPYPLPGDWGRVLFYGSSSNSSNIRYGVFQYADKGTRMENSSPHFAHCSVRHNMEQGIYANNSNFILDSSMVNYNGSGVGGYSGIVILDSAPHLRGTFSENNTNHGLALEQVYGGEILYGGFSYNDNSGIMLDFSCYGVEIAYNHISYNQDYGINIDNCNTNYEQLDIHHNLVYHNVLDGFYLDTSKLKVINNTIVFNERDGIYAYSCNLNIYNNIVASNDHRGIYLQSTSYLMDYNDVWNNYTANYLNCVPGFCDISENPLFENQLLNNYNLQDSSACIDAGNPSQIYNDPDSTRNDMGALYHNQSQVNPWEKGLSPQSPVLLYNYPNPFNEETAIIYEFSVNSLPPDAFKIYDNMGREIMQLPLKGMKSGSIRWDGRDADGNKIVSGMYYCSAGNFTIKMLLLK